MISKNKSLDRFQAYVEAQPLTPSGEIHIHVSAKLHTRIYGLLGRRDKTKMYRFTLPNTPNGVVLHRREHVGLLPAGTRFIGPSEKIVDRLSLQIITQFEAVKGFVPATMIDERHQFSEVQDLNDLRDWIEPRLEEMSLVTAYGGTVIELPTIEIQMEFRTRWE